MDIEQWQKYLTQKKMLNLIKLLESPRACPGNYLGAEVFHNFFDGFWFMYETMMA